jgi:hypothetical protein
MKPTQFLSLPRRALHARAASFLLTLLLAQVGAWAQPVQGQPGWLDLKAFQSDMRRRLDHRQSPSEEKYEQARNHAAAVWIPKLIASEQAGDPFASWILHDCDALYDLPRPGIDTTCSIEPDQRERATRQLEASPVANDMRHLRTLVDNVHGTAANDTVCKDDQACRLTRLTQTLQDLRQTIVRTGILPPLSPLNFCMPAQGAEARELRAQCQMAAHHVFALHTLARSHLSWSLDDGPDDAGRLSDHPYAHFGDLSLDEKVIPKATTPEGMAFHGKFYGEVYHDLEAMDANLARRSAEEPRWRVLMRSVPVGAEAGIPLDKRAARLRKKPKELAALFENRIMQRFAGTYRGQLISTGTSHAITTLYPSSSRIVGRYLMVYGDKPDAKVELGLLGPCTARGQDELLCIWRDPYGIGNVSFSFNRSRTEFRGMYGDLDPEAGSFEHVEKVYWKDLTLWNGRLQ